MNPFDSDGSKEEIQVSVRKSNKKKTKLRFKKKKKKNPEHAITVPNLYDVEDKRITDRSGSLKTEVEKEIETHDRITLKQQVQEKAKQDNKVLVHTFASKGNFPKEKKSKNPFDEDDDGDEEAEDKQFFPKTMEEPEFNISRFSENTETLGLNHKGATVTEKDDKITNESLKRKRSSSVRQRMSKIQKSLRKRSKSHPEAAKCKSASETQKEVTHEVSRQSPVSDLKIMEPISSVSVVEGRLEKGKRKSTNPFEEDDDDYIEESIPQRNLTSERKYMAAPFLRPGRQDIGISPKTRLSKDDETNQTAMIDRNPMPRNVPSSVPRNVQTLVPSNVLSSVPRNVPSSVPSNVSSSVPRNANFLLPSNVPYSVPSNVPSSVPRNVPMIDSNRPSNMVKQSDGEERDSSTKKKKSLSIHRQFSRIHKSLKKKSEGDAKDGSPTDSSTTIEMTKMSSVESNVESQPRTKREDSRPEERIGLKAMNIYEERAIDVPHPIDVRSIPIKEAKEYVDIEESKSTNEVEDTVANENEKGDDKKRYPFQLTRSLSKVRSSFRKKSKSHEKEKNENADIQQEVLASVTVESINNAHFENGLNESGNDFETLSKNQSDDNYHGEGFLYVNRLPKNPFETDEPEQVDDDVVEIVDETTEKSNNGSQVSFRRGFSKLRSSFKRKSKNLQKESPKEVPLETTTESDILKKNQENAREEVELSPAGMSPKKQPTIDEVLADLGCTPDGREINPTDDPFETDEENVNLKKKNPLQRGVSKVRSSFRRKPKNDEEQSESAFKDQSQNKQESVKEEVELSPPVQAVPQKQPTVEEVLADLGCTPDGREINPTDDTFEETAHYDDNDGGNIYGINKNLSQRRAFKMRSPFKKKSKNPPNETLSDSTDIHGDMSKSREVPKAEVLSDREFSPEERGTTDIPEKSSNKQKPKKKKHKKHEERDTECIEPLLKPITTVPMRSEDFTVRGPQKVPPSKHQLIEMRSTVDDVKHSLCDNLLKLEDRAGNLDDLETLADSLSEKTTYFVKCSSKVKKKMRCRDYKWRIIIFTSVSIIILVIVLVIIVFITKNTDNNQSKTLVATNVTNSQKY